MLLKYAVSADEYLEAEWAYRMRMARSRILFRNLYAVSLVAILLGVNARLSDAPLLADFLFAVGAGLLLERACLWRVRAAAKYRKVAAMAQPIELRIDENNLMRSSAEGTEEIRWANILACHEARRVFVLLIRPEAPFALPKRVFSAGELHQFRELAKRELIVRTTRRNPDALLLRFAVAWAIAAFGLGALSIGYVHNFLTQIPGAPRAAAGRSRPTPSVTPDSRKAAPGELRGRGMVYLVPLGKGDAVPGASLADAFRRKYALEIHQLPAMDLPAWAWNASRKQLVAEDLVTAMKINYPKLAADPSAILIGLTDEDMYIQKLNWSYAFSFRQEERFAVISTARLSEDEEGKRSLHSADLGKRTLKVLIRDIGILHYRLQPSSDFHSILYQELDAPSDLDDIGDDYLETDAAVRADLHVENGDPCFILRSYSAADRQLPLIGVLDSCSGYYKERNLETVQVDLRYGLLLDQRTDFLTSDRWPVELTRVLRTQDSRSRAFGIGGNHNLNIFLVGDKWPFTWMDLVLEHGGRSHFRRSNWGFGYWDARYSNRDAVASEFTGSTIQWDWPGWKLRKGGLTYHFPDSDRAIRPEQSALTSIESYNGTRLTLDRDPAGNLMLARSPGGHDLRFKYDPQNRIIEVDERAGGQFLYSYDSGHLTQVTDDGHQITSYAYDSSGRMQRVQQNGSQVCAIEYDGAGRVRAERLGNGREYLFDYSTSRDGGMAMVRVSDSAGPLRTIRFFGSDYVLDPGESSTK